MIVTNQKGYILASVISISALVFIIGSSAIYMTSVGSQTVSSEIQYSKAREAAEYGINKAGREIGLRLNQNISNGNACVITPLNDSPLSELPNVTYSYKTVKDDLGNSCLIYAMGKITGTNVKVVKTAMVPVKLLANPPSANNTAARAGNISNATVNGNNIAFGNNCGGPGVASNSIGSTALDNLSASNGSAGTPPVLVDPNLPNIYSATFGAGITNRDTLNVAIDAITAAKLADTTIPASCKIAPTSGNINNTNCNTNNQGKIECTGGLSQTIDPSACSQVVILAGSVNIQKNMPTSTKFTINASNNLNVENSITGLISSKNVLNVNASGNNTFEGIFIGANADNLNIAGNNAFRGLYFVGNDSHNTNLNVVSSGNTGFLGSMVVDGNINNYTRNGGGNAQGQDYNFQYNADVINNWGSQYPNLLAGFGCGVTYGTPPQIGSMLNDTKMTMF